MAGLYSGRVWKAVLLSALMLAIAMVIDGQDESDFSLAGPGGRFNMPVEFGGTGRRLLNGNSCGSGRAPYYGCQRSHPHWKLATCCFSHGTGHCRDVGDNSDLHCGACNNKCRYGLDCCNGKCVNEDTDRNNCGRCGRRCPNGQPCRRGNCGYGH